MTCSKCGVTMTADSPDQLCPRCLLAAAMESGTSPATSAHSHGFVPPSVPELQKLFPTLEILELLGKGGMGAVYKARQITLDRFVAVKILPPHFGGDPAFAERFAREARSLARLSHANIVGVYDFGQAGGQFYFLMEYVDGVNIRQAMRAGTLSPVEALKIVPQICDALQFAHDEGIVHRDIKPENILLDKKGRVKIADFGLAKLLGQDATEERLTGTQQTMGTIHYMAPEQVEGAKQVDHRADIYSLGVTFYEMLTGELPLGVFRPPSQRAAVDVRLDQIVLKTLEKSPGDRYQHVSEVKSDVELIGVALPNIALQGREYKSKTMIFGLPLVHMAFGSDAKGNRLVAKGIVAIGDRAIGVLAMGGVAMGGVCLGGVTVGLVCFGGLALGLLAAIGGLAIGGVAVGGLAVGVVSLGGLGAGYYALGGGGLARFGLFGDRQDPEAIAFFESWWIHGRQWLTPLAIATPLAGLVLGGFVWMVARPRTDLAQAGPGGSSDRRWSGITIALVVLALVGAVTLFLPWTRFEASSNGPLFDGPLFADVFLGTQTWQAPVVAGLFFGIACLRLGTANLGPRVALTIVTIGLAIASVAVVSVFIANTPAPSTSPKLRQGVQTLQLAAPGMGVNPASDGRTILGARQAFNLAIILEATFGAYLALICGAGMILLSVVELSKFVGREPRPSSRQV